MFGKTRRKNPKPSLRRAIKHVNQAVKIAYKYKRDKNYKPSKADLRNLHRLTHLLWQKHLTAQHIGFEMHHRYIRERQKQRNARKQN